MPYELNEIELMTAESGGQICACYIGFTPSYAFAGIHKRLYDEAKLRSRETSPQCPGSKFDLPPLSQHV